LNDFESQKYNILRTEEEGFLFAIASTTAPELHQAGYRWLLKQAQLLNR
jgi:hypothetical protein